MAAVRRLAAGGLASVIGLVLMSVSANAAVKPIAPAHPAAPPAPVRTAGVLPPQIYQLNPVKVNPSVLPNVMIVGQHMTPSTTAEIGGRPAMTLEVADTNHLLVKLPENLSQGSYLVAVTNEAGTALASDRLVIDDPTLRPSTLMMLVGGGFLLLLFLLMRLARTPGIA
jgi:hypothetical protein